MAASDYRHRKHINAVLCGSKATYSAWSVLEAMCRLAEFDRPEVTITKGQLLVEARRSWPRVKMALQFLRDEGSILPIRNFAGGRGNATTYRLCVVGKGVSEPLKDIAGQGKGTVWHGIAAQYKATDPNEYRAWLHKLEFASFEGNRLVLIAPTAFHAAHCRTQLADKVLAVANGAGNGVKKIEFIAA